MSTISVIVPCYNEEETILPFYAEAERVRKEDFSDTDVSFEYIFVDDGSSDGTVGLMRRLHREDPAVRYLSFSRNFGKEAAILAGLEAATGEYVTLLDADLQDPPSMLRQMYDAIVNEGYDQVGTRRVTRKGEPLVRSLCARAFYKIINRLSDVEMVSGARDFRLMRRRVVDAILSMPEKCRYSKGIFSYVGFRTKWLPYENVERVAGQSKWTGWQLVKYAVTGIFSFSTAPLVLSTVLGGLFLLGAAVLFVLSLICGGLTLPLSALGLFIGGSVLLGVGFLGQYLSRVYTEVKARPVYILRETERDAEACDCGTRESGVSASGEGGRS